MRIYFDNAATTPLAPEVIERMTELMQEVYGNPSSIHAEGRKARTVVEEARKTVAGLLKASIGEIFFTSGGTESSNMVLKDAGRDLGIRRFISSPTEHHCVLHTLQRLQKETEAEVIWLKVDEKGRPDLMQLEALLQSSDVPTLVSLMHANNEIGTLLDLKKVGTLCHENGALFHSDTVQTIGYYPIDLSALPVDFITGSAHKFYGPKGTGFVYIKGDHQLQPYIDGGSQERNLRAGTENIYGIAGLARALELAYENLEARRAHTTEVRNYLRDRLVEAVPGIHFHSPPDGECHYKVLSASFPPSLKSEYLIMNFDIAGISASGGSACSSGAEKASHVLEAIGGDPDRKTIRFSFSHNNTKAEVDEVIGKIQEVLEPGPPSPKKTTARVIR